VSATSSATCRSGDQQSFPTFSRRRLKAKLGTVNGWPILVGAAVGNGGEVRKSVCGRGECGRGEGCHLSLRALIVLDERLAPYE